MENNQPTPNESHGNVMDVQMPRPPQVPINTPPTSGPGVPLATTSAPIAPITPSPAPHQEPIVPTHPTPEQGPPKPPEHKTNSIPTVVVIIAIVVAASLIGLAVFAYLHNKDMPNDEHHHMSSTEEVTTTDVDNTGKDVDDTLNSANDTKDLPESDLSDQALGL